MKTLREPSRWDRDTGAFKAWPIVLGNQLNREVTVIYPEGHEVAGVAFRDLADLFLDPKAHQIVIQPAALAQPADIRGIAWKVCQHRDGGNLLKGWSPALVASLTEPILLVDGLGDSWKVIRCVEVGCDSFNGWHRADGPKVAHTTCDVSGETYRCRLMLKAGVWTLDVGVRGSWAEDPVKNGADLARAISKASATAAEMNGWLSTGESQRAKVNVRRSTREHG